MALIRRQGRAPPCRMCVLQIGDHHRHLAEAPGGTAQRHAHFRRQSRVQDRFGPAAILQLTGHHLPLMLHSRPYFLMGRVQKRADLLQREFQVPEIPDAPEPEQGFLGVEAVSGLRPLGGWHRPMDS